MLDYTIVSAFRNKDQVDRLYKGICDKGYSCFNFADAPADPNNPENDYESQMKAYESTEDFMNNEYFKFLFKKDKDALVNAQNVILLLPAGISAHMEIGMAHGMGKKCILIGKPNKPESLYLLFDECFDTIEDFINKI